jgi:hypothetical protein
MEKGRESGTSSAAYPTNDENACVVPIPRCLACSPHQGGPRAPSPHPHLCRPYETNWLGNGQGSPNEKTKKYFFINLLKKHLTHCKCSGIISLAPNIK